MSQLVGNSFLFPGQQLIMRLKSEMQMQGFGLFVCLFCMCMYLCCVSMYICIFTCVFQMWRPDVDTGCLSLSCSPPYLLGWMFHLNPEPSSLSKLASKSGHDYRQTASPTWPGWWLAPSSRSPVDKAISGGSWLLPFASLPLLCPRVDLSHCCHCCFLHWL